MADITKCEGHECPLKDSCYRYLVSEGMRQAYFIEVPFNEDLNKCDYYLPKRK